MDEQDTPGSCLNVFEIVTEGVHRHLICFLRSDRAQEAGIDPRGVVGEFTPGEGEEFDPKTFVLNTEFINALTSYMNEEAIKNPGMEEEGRKNVGGWLYLLDPRFPQEEGKEPEPADILGGFAVSDEGEIVPDSFYYNEEHVWFDAVNGVSGVLSDRRFYDWLYRS